MTAMNLEDFISSYIPVPVCVINQKGKIICAGEKIGEVFLYDDIVDSDIFALTGIRASELYDAAEEKTHPILKRNEKKFKLICHRVSQDSDGNLAILFDDVTNLEELRQNTIMKRFVLQKFRLITMMSLFQIRR